MKKTQNVQKMFSRASTLAALIILFFCSTTAIAGTIKDYLLPQPKTLKTAEGQFSFPKGRIISGLVNDDEVLPIIKSVQEALYAATGRLYPVAGIAAEGEHTVVSVSLSNAVTHSQGYELTISPNNITIVAKDKPGLAYAVLTLKQAFRFHKENGYLPALSITDWPDIERRGVMLDISRDKVPTMKSLYRYIDQLADWKINEIQLYTEHTFAYTNHKAVWENASPVTAQEIVEFDAYCKKRFIRLTPNQNSFAHMNRWLKHDAYSNLSEFPNSGVITPAEPGSLKLLDELYRELLPNFTSEYFNIGCDETERLGSGKAKAMADQKGKGQVYLDFVLDLKKLAEKNGRKVQFWGDIILHHPEMIPTLPKDITALIWGYEDNHPFDKQCPVFANAGIDFYVCPGTSSWNAIIGRSANAFENLRNAARNGKKYGAKGFLNTDWGDNGHWQPITVSHPANLYGAAVSWGIEENKDIDVAQFLNSQVFGDSKKQAGDVVIKLGDAYLQTGVLTENSNVFFSILMSTGKPFSQQKALSKLDKEKLQQTIGFIDQQLARLDSAQMSCADASQVVEELQLAAALCKHACKQAIYKLSAAKGDIKNVPAAQKTELKKELEYIITRYCTVWMGRNRSGGLSDSVDRLTTVALNFYQ